MNVAKAVAGLIFITVATALVAGNVLPFPRGRAEAAVAATAERRVPAFDKIRLSGAFSTRVSVGPRRRVTISADPDVVAQVTTTVEEGTLEVGMRDGTMTHGPVHLDIAVERLRGFENSGAGSTDIAGIRDDVTIANGGTGSITAAGKAHAVTITQSGVGKIDASALDAGDVTASNDGVGSVLVRGSGRLALTVNGVGEIRYAGSPQHVDKTVNGIGRISAL